MDTVQASKPVTGILGGCKSGYQKHHFHVLISLVVKREIEGILVG